MEKNDVIVALDTAAGIQRDGTEFDNGNFFVDGQWVRFYRNRPRKMGGYREFSDGLTGTPRAVHSWRRKDITLTYRFSNLGAECVATDRYLVGASVVDVTPAGFVASDDYTWQTAAIFDAAVGSNKTLLVAHASKSLTNIDDDTPTQVYYRDASDVGTTRLQPLGSLQVSGGVCAVHPFLVAYGSDGYLAWSNENEPANFSSGNADTARVTGSKIVKGMAKRGGGRPAALLWSLDSVLAMRHVGGEKVFDVEVLSEQSSVLSSSGFVEYDGFYFWMGVDRFLMFDSSVKELPNSVNLNWILDGLNYDHAQKVWATKIPRFGEIWWFYPRYPNTECSHAVIYNVREKSWYDCELARSAGASSRTSRHPIMAAAGSLYQHEFGVDALQGGEARAIQSWFETGDIGLTSGAQSKETPQGMNRWTRLTRVEPDFVQTGNLRMKIIGRRFPRSAAEESSEFVLSPSTELVDMREHHRQLKLRFSSDEVGGYYEMGRVMLHLGMGDGRS